MPEVFQGTPAWYSGEQGVLKQLIDKTFNLPKGYPAFGGQRVAKQTGRQQNARDIAERISGNVAFPQMFEQGRNALGRSTNANTAATVNPYVQNATQSPVIGIGEYMNPYQQHVAQNMAQLVNRNLMENILPSIQSQYLNSGQRRSARQETATQKALRGANEAIARETGNLMHRGYDQALQARLSNQQANLQGGFGLGSAQARDTEQQNQGALGLGNLANQYQMQNLRSADVLNQLGVQDQAQEQQQMNTSYRDFLNQADYPRRQLAFESEMARGLAPSTTSSFAPEPPVTPFMPSPWTQGGGMVGAASGLMGMNEEQRRRQMGYAEGGRVKMASGGNPLMDGVQDAMNNEDIGALQGYAQEFSQPNMDPQASGMTRMGLELLANNQPTAMPGPGGRMMVNPQGGAFSALGQAGLGGFNEYKDQLNLIDQRKKNAVNIHDVINRTRQWQHQQQLSREQFEAQKSHQEGSLGLQRERFNFEKEQVNKPKGPEIIKDANGASYQAVIDPETGKIRAVPIEGMSRVNDKKLEKEYANELKGASENSRASEDIRNDLQLMKSIQPTIGPTGPIAGAIPDYVATLGGFNGDVGNRQVFQASSNRLLSTILKTQKGAQSDADMAVFATTKPGTNKTEDANKIMIEYGDKIAQRAMEYEQFLLDSKEEGKPLAQSKKEWKDHVNANPIIQQGTQSQSMMQNSSIGLDQNPFMGQSREALEARKAELEAMIGQQ